MKVNPCKNKRSALCCQESNESVCEDNIIITSGKDVPVAWFIGGYIIQCSQEYTKLGT